MNRIERLPKGWQLKKLGEVCKIQTGKYDANHAKELGKYRFYTCAFEYLFCDTNRFNGESLILPGNGANVGEVFYYNGEFDAYQRTYVLNEIQTIPKYLYYHLLGNWKKINQDKQFGTATNYIRMGNFTDYNVLIPPVAEQQAIVAKIEELLSELENGKQQLLTAQQQLKVYRQSMLQWAFEGKLTNKVVMEGVLPKGWKLVKIEEAALSLDNKRKPINKNERLSRIGTIPYYGANGRVGWIDDYIFDEPLVCVVEDETFTGRTIPFSYKISGKTWVNNHAHVLKAKDNLNLDFLNYQLAYYPFLRLTTGTTGRKKLTKYALMNAPIKICTLEEQQLIVSELESKLTVCDKIEETISESLQQAETLRQSILKKAFEGKLV